MSVNRTLAHQVEKLRARTGLPFAVAGWSTRDHSQWRLVLARDLERPDFFTDSPAGPVVPKAQLPAHLKGLHAVLDILDGSALPEWCHVET